MDTEKVEDEYFEELTILNLAFLSCDNRHGVVFDLGDSITNRDLKLFCLSVWNGDNVNQHISKKDFNVIAVSTSVAEPHRNYALAETG